MMIFLDVVGSLREWFENIDVVGVGGDCRVDDEKNRK
jgi:hypothetical protein